MDQEHAISRRQFLLTSTATAASGLISGCDGGIISTELIAESVLFIPLAVNIVADIVYDYGVHPLLQSLTPVAEAAEAAGANKDVCKKAAEIAGTDWVVAALKNGVPIWCSRNKDVKEANAFHFTVRNKTDKEVGGQIQFGLKDTDTGQIEKTFWWNGFVAHPRIATEKSFGGFTDPFAPGNKRIVTMRAPAGIEVDDIKLIVLPMSIRHA